ncbi:MAG: hypothetical protein RBR02_10145 [Desulfuromonadaceae bacterium]|nr:hypothetical protein [Desulfuromonadaceae bacterium]
MSNFVNKHFKKKKSIKLLIHYPDHTSKEFWVIPKNNAVTVDKKTFIIDSENIFYMKNRRCYMYKYDTVAPINPLNFTAKLNMTSEGLYQYAETRVFDSLMKATGSMDKLFMISIGLSIMSLLGLIFMFTTLSDSLKEIREALEAFRIGG